MATTVFTTKTERAYQDLDGDTFGNSGVSVEACDAPIGYVLDNTDCDDIKLPYSPEGIWTIHKLNTGNTVHGDYIVDIDTFDGTIFSGTGTRDVTGNKNGDTLYVNISGTVDGSGTMSIHMDQWFIEAKTGTAQNSFDFLGTTGECGGITEVHHLANAAQQFWLIQY